MRSEQWLKLMYAILSVVSKLQAFLSIEVMSCPNNNSMLACEQNQIVVIDDVLALYGTGDCHGNFTCNSTTAAVSQVNECTWQHSSCTIAVNKFQITAPECFPNSLSRFYINFYCVSHAEVLNFNSQVSQTIELNQLNESFYVLSPCFPRHYSNCEYYQANAPSAINVNSLPGLTTNIEKLEMHSCDLQVLRSDGSNLGDICAQHVTEMLITEESFMLKFTGLGNEQGGFLLQLTVVESLNNEYLSTTPSSTNEHYTEMQYGTTLETWRAKVDKTRDGSENDILQRSTFIAVVVIATFIVIISILVTIGYLKSRRHESGEYNVSDGNGGALSEMPYPRTTPGNHRPLANHRPMSNGDITSDTDTVDGLLV